MLAFNRESALELLQQLGHRICTVEEIESAFYVEGENGQWFDGQRRERPLALADSVNLTAEERTKLVAYRSALVDATGRACSTDDIFGEFWADILAK